MRWSSRVYRNQPEPPVAHRATPHPGHMSIWVKQMEFYGQKADEKVVVGMRWSSRVYRNHQNHRCPQYDATKVLVGKAD